MTGRFGTLRALILSIAAGTLALALDLRPAAAYVDFDLGSDPAIDVTVTQDGATKLRFDVSMTSATNVIGELRGLFFHYNAVAGTQLTFADLQVFDQLKNGGAGAWVSVANPLTATGNNTVCSLSGSNNVNGASTCSPGYDAAIQFSGQGTGGDDVRAATFTVSLIGITNSLPQTIDLENFFPSYQGAENTFTLMAARVMSVGVAGSNRGGSLKLVTKRYEVVEDPEPPTPVPVPPTLLLLLSGLAVLVAGRRFGLVPAAA